MPRKEYKLVKLKASTVQDLKHLTCDTGEASVDALIVEMIKITRKYRSALQRIGWGHTSREET